MDFLQKLEIMLDHHPCKVPDLSQQLLLPAFRPVADSAFGQL
jgi:hypothetical protein